MFNSFNDGPWLLWFGAGRLQHYVDPRNQSGAYTLAHYVEMLHDASAFDAEVARTDIGLVLLPLQNTLLEPLAEHIAASTDYSLVYWNGFYALYARDRPVNATLRQRFGYHVVRPTLDLRYLDRQGLDEAELTRELERLTAQSRLHADVIRAYRKLRSADRQSAGAAARVIADAWPELPDKAGLARALSGIDPAALPH
jgi:hypothetical protein